MYLNGNVKKPVLKENPFLRLLEHGQGKDGYWTYNHMVLQIEDVMDCMAVLFPDVSDPRKCWFDVCFELDHSSGHAKDRTDGLSTLPTALNFGIGGAQRKMQSTVITEGCLRSEQHEQKLNVGDTQHMIFLEDAAPPVSDLTFPKHDTPLGTFDKKTAPLLTSK